MNASGTQYPGSSEYRYLDFPTEYYRPAVVETDDGARLKLKNVTAAEIVTDLAYPYDMATDVARAVVREGNATVHRDVPGRDQIIERNGTYYAVEYRGSLQPPLGGWVPRYRWPMWLGTVPLSFAAMWRWT